MTSGPCCLADFLPPQRQSCSRTNDKEGVRSQKTRRLRPLRVGPGGVSVSSASPVARSFTIRPKRIRLHRNARTCCPIHVREPVLPKMQRDRLQPQAQVLWLLWCAISRRVLVHRGGAGRSRQRGDRKSVV